MLDKIIIFFLPSLAIHKRKDLYNILMALDNLPFFLEISYVWLDSDADYCALISSNDYVIQWLNDNRWNLFLKRGYVRHNYRTNSPLTPGRHRKHIPTTHDHNNLKIKNHFDKWEHVIFFHNVLWSYLYLSWNLVN